MAGVSSFTGNTLFGGGGSSLSGDTGGFLARNTRNNLDSPDALLAIAQSQGGSLAAAATELVHPQTSILSTIGNGFKNAFHDFVDVISLPSQIVAGSLSSTLTVQDAIKQNVSPADVIWGKENPNANGMEKIGGFLVRTATNVLLDPLTYVTFGTGQGLLGLRAATEVSLGEKASAILGKEVSSVGALSKEGQGVYSFLKGVERQMKGDTGYEILKTGDASLDLAGSELQTLLKGTIDSPLNPDFAKIAISNMLEKAPQLTETYLDHGGIKFFGQTVLSGQRLSATAALIPGMSKLDEFTRPIRMAIAAPFNPNLIKDGAGNWTRLPPEYVDAFQDFKDLASSWADKNVRDITNIIEANELSIPETKFLTASVEAGYRPADSRLANAWDQFFKLGKDQYEMMRKAGIPVAYLNNYVPHMTVKTQINSLPFKLPLSEKAGAAIHRTLEGPIFDATPERLAQLEEMLKTAPKQVDETLNGMRREGFEIFDDNIATAWINRTLDNTRATTARYFMRNIAENFGVPQSVGSLKGYVGIDSKGIKNASEEFVNRVFGEGGEQMVYHPALAKHIETFLGSVINDDGINSFFKNFDKLQNFWKASVTSFFPAFHGRNAISNVLQNMMDLGWQAIHPAINYQAAQMQHLESQAQKLTLAAMKPGAGEPESKALNELFSRKVFTDTTGHEWTFGELRQTIKQHNIAFTSRSAVTSADLNAGPEQMAKNPALFPQDSIKGKIKSGISKTMAFPQNTVGSSIEDHSRLVNFMANLRGTGDVTLAAKRTKQFLFDYSNLTNFERHVMRRLLPFYTYTRKNLELQVRTLATTPGRISAELQALTTLGETLSGGQQLTKEEQDALPDWMKSGIGVLTKKNGELVTMLSTLGTPIEQPFQALQPNQFLGSLSPLIRTPLEQASGYSFFQGKPLSDVTNATSFVHAPQFLKDFIGFTAINAHRSDGTPFTMYVALHPERMNLVLNLPPTTRVFSSLKQMEAANVSDQAKILQQLIGIKPYSFDLEQEAQKRQNEMKAQLEKLLTSAGVTAKFSTTYIPKAQKKQLFSGE